MAVFLPSAPVVMEIWPPPGQLSGPNFFPIALACFFFASAHSVPHLLGVHPLDEKYYASEVIQCKDGAKSFTRDRLNDDFWDCIDGTDEPGTSACAAGKFYCRNMGSTPEFIFHSRINDHFCDCCDGSDEYDGSINCPNTCVMGGNFEYKMEDAYFSRFHDAANRGTKTRVEKTDLIQKLKGLKMVIILQVVFVISAVVFKMIRRRLRSKKRRTFTLRSS